MKNIDYKELLKRTGLEDNQVLSAYMYGSRVYGNYTDKSDWDFILVTRDGEPSWQFSDNMINVNLFRKDVHQQRIDEHEISALECIWLRPEFILKETQKYKFKLDLAKLRHSISAKSSNSWVKAKKKLTVDKDYNDSVGKKSLWHSIRIVMFGTQIAKCGEIKSYDCFNYEYNNILHCYDWTEMFENYKQFYNQGLTAFRALAPK